MTDGDIYLMMMMMMKPAKIESNQAS